MCIQFWRTLCIHTHTHTHSLPCLYSVPICAQFDLRRNSLWRNYCVSCGECLYVPLSHTTKIMSVVFWLMIFTFPSSIHFFISSLFHFLSFVVTEHFSRSVSSYLSLPLALFISSPLLACSQLCRHHTAALSKQPFSLCLHSLRIRVHLTCHRDAWLWRVLRFIFFAQFGLFFFKVNFIWRSSCWLT